MPTCLFISGKNWMLSLAELTAYFKARDIRFEIQFFSGEFFALSFEKEFESTIIDGFGWNNKNWRSKNKVFNRNNQGSVPKKKQASQIRQIIESLASSSIVEGMAKSEEKVLFGVSVYCTENTLRSSFHGVSSGLSEALLKMNWLI